MLVELRPSVVFGQYALESGVVAFDGNHSVVDELADGGLLGLGLQGPPARLFGHPEDVGPCVFVTIFEGFFEGYRYVGSGDGLLTDIGSGVDIPITLGAERALNESLAGVVQFSLATPVMKGFQDRELDRAPTNLVFGLTGRFGEAWRWDVSFQEDIPSDTPAVDFTLGMRLSRSW